MATTRPYHPPVRHALPQAPVDYEADDLEEDEEAEDDLFYEDEEEEDHSTWLAGSTASKFLLAGGIAGAGAFQLFSVHRH